MEKDNILKELIKLKCSSKHKTTDEQLYKAREKAVEQLEEKFRRVKIKAHRKRD